MEDKRPGTLEVPTTDPVSVPDPTAIEAHAVEAAPREDQVQSAVGFLSHPKVRAITIWYRMHFEPTTQWSGTVLQCACIYYDIS